MSGFDSGSMVRANPTGWLVVVQKDTAVTLEESPGYQDFPPGQVRLWDSGDRDRSQATDCRAIAELTRIIPPPAEGPIIGGHPTAVAADAGRAHLMESESAGDPDRRRAMVDRRAIANLPVRVLPPAEGHIIRVHAAGMEGARTHRAEASTSDRNRRRATIVPRQPERPNSPAVSPLGRGHAAGEEVIRVLDLQQREI